MHVPDFSPDKSLFPPRKYEEIYPPDVDEFVYITDDTYTKRQLLRMEHLLLKVLAFDLTVPTTNQFLLQYLRRQGVCIRTENLAKVCHRTSRDSHLPSHPPPPPLPGFHLSRDERQLSLKT